MAWFCRTHTTCISIPLFFFIVAYFYFRGLTLTLSGFVRPTLSVFPFCLLSLSVCQSCITVSIKLQNGLETQISAKLSRLNAYYSDMGCVCVRRRWWQSSLCMAGGRVRRVCVHVSEWYPWDSSQVRVFMRRGSEEDCRRRDVRWRSRNLECLKFERLSNTLE